MHKSVDLPIYYFGTPVVLISTTNDDGTTNIAPSSSIWWLGKSCMIGLDGSSKTTQNIKRTGECVLNLASDDIADVVDSLANTTGSKSIPLHKRSLGYSYVKDKISVAKLTEQQSLSVAAKRIGECKVQLEAKVANTHSVAKNNKNAIIPMFAFELDIIQTHIEESILTGKNKQYVDPDKWHPLIMSFRKFYTTHDYIHPSSLAHESVEKYRLREYKGLKGYLINNVFKLLYRKHRSTNC